MILLLFVCLKSKVSKIFSGHESNVTFLLPFANQLISTVEDNFITYLNKILFASKQGTM